MTSIKASRDEQRELCDALGDSVLSAANLAAEYWLMAAGDSRIQLMEARLLGSQAYLASFRILALGWFSPKDRREVELELADFYDALTGGDFKSPRRSVDPNRAEQCQVQAALLAVLIRRGNLKSLTMRAHLMRLLMWHPVSEFIQDQFRWTPRGTDGP